MTSRNIRNIVTGLFCALAIGTLAAEPAPLVIPETPPPKLDGTLDDPAWQQAAKIDTLYLYNSDTPVKDTTVYVARDNKWLYLGFKCVNSNMAHVSQLVYNNDDPVCNDESVEVFIKPAAADERYYHFMLNFANVQKEQRCNKDGLRDIGWTPPWRSMTKRLPNGWTAEIAIPLFVLECDDLSGMQINLCRNFMNIELDQMGAKQAEQKVYHALKSGNKGSFHNFKNFVAVSGLGGFKPEIPFAPRITAAEVTGLIQKDGKYFYDVKLTLETASAVAGKAKVQIIEDMGAGDVEKLSELVDLDGKRELVFSVPAGDLRERKVKVALVDTADGTMLAGRMIDDTSAISIIKKAFVGRSYYTTEANADIRLELGLPKTMLKQAVLTIDVNGKKVSETKGLKPVMTPEIPLSALKIGDNALNVRLVSAGKELATRNLSVQRLAPRPGFEVKTDFIKGVMLKDDQPVFPVGLCAHRLGRQKWSDGEKGMFKFLSEVGFNMLVRTAGRFWKWDYKDVDMFMKLADKYGMNVITWSSPQPWPIGMKKGTWPPPPVTLPLAERLAFQKEWYKKLEPGLIEETKIFREHRNLLAYWNVDEPNLVNRHERIAVAEWYWNTVTPLDPYRPQFLLYSKHIPQGDNWTRWGQILGYDVYPRPFTPGMYGDPGLATAYYAYELRERCRQDNKVMFFVPIAGNLGPPRSPIGMNKAHMLCQAYSAIIYGSRGLLYFALPLVVGEDAWDALRTITAQVKELSPALLNGDIAQEIRYTPDNFKPTERKFPMVNAAVFQYPDGAYLLMAVNIMPFAVDTTFKVSGLKRTVRLFEDREKQSFGDWMKAVFSFAGGGNSFTDKIEGYGVRAYRLTLGPSAVPVKVALDMTALEDEKAPSVDLPGIVRQVMLGKNHVPNPCFKQQFNKGIPDFYQPFFCLGVDPDAGKKGSTWYVDNEMLWNGHPSLKMFRDKAGSEKTRGTWGTWYLPASDKPVKMTFSFYAKCDKAGKSIWVRVLGQDKTLLPPLTTEWKRYSITGDVSPGSRSNMGGRALLVCGLPGTTVWISGLQMEAGDKPTEFQDDSILIKKSK